MKKLLASAVLTVTVVAGALAAAPADSSASPAGTSSTGEHLCC